MDDTDEDFGDLYADVELQATTVINCFPNSSDSTIAERIGSVFDEESKKFSNGDGDCEEEEEEVIVDNGSDSEDDLNIVLNGDDGDNTGFRSGVDLGIGGFGDGEEEEMEGGDLGRKNQKWGNQGQFGDGVELSSNGGGGEKGNGTKGGYQSQFSQYKYIRPHAAAYPSNSNVNGSVGMASFSSAFIRGDWEDNGSNQRMGSNSLFAQSGYTISLPRNKTILDVNIDTLERKPWRHPGTDITSFFNFGFDEESWKDYCNCLDQCRLQTSMSVTKIPVYEPAQCSEQKGRAIQVEDSTIERRPSFDVNCLRVRDSDVVIQIPLHNASEDSSGSDKEEVGNIDSPVCEASVNVDFGVANATDIHCSGSVSGEELPRESLDGNIGGLDACLPETCSQQTTPSNPLSVDSDNDGSGQISDANLPHRQKITVHDLEGNAQVLETSNNTGEEVGKDKKNKAPTNMEVESSFGEQSQHSHLSLSCSGSYSEAPHEKVHDHIRRSSPNSASELRESVTSDYYHANDSKRRDVKRKPSDCKYYSQHRNHTRDDRRQYNRLHSVSKFKRQYEENASPMTRYEENASPMSSTEGLYDADHSTVDRNRVGGRLKSSSSHDREHLLDLRDSELSLNYCRGRHYDDQVQAGYSKDFHMKGRQRFGDGRERYFCREEEGDYYLEERIARINGEVMKRDWYRHKRGPIVDDMETLACRDSRAMLHRSSYLEKRERGTWWREKGDELHFRKGMGNNDFVEKRERSTWWREKGDELHFRKGMVNNEFLIKRNYTHDFVQEKDGIFVPHDDTDYLNNVYERDLPRMKREFGSSARRERTSDAPSSDLENLWSKGDEYHRHTGDRSLSNGGRWHDSMPPRNDAYGLRKNKMQGSHMIDTWTDRCRNNDWLDSYNHTSEVEENIGYPDRQGHFERRRPPWHSGVFHRTENEYISRNRDGECLPGKESFSLRRTSRHNKFHAEHVTGNGLKPIDDRQVLHHSYKRIREGNSDSHIDRSSNTTHRDNIERTLPRCGDSVDLHLVGGEGKSSGRCSAAGGLMSNGRIENTDSNIDKEMVLLDDFNEPHLEMVNQIDYRQVEKSQNDEKWHDKFPVPRHNEALDIEEGQIITEDFNENRMEKDQIVDVKGRNFLGNEKNGIDGKKVVKENNNPRILEMIAKMEKRRERFKEPITVKKEGEKISEPSICQSVETVEVNLQRPARKRRWGGN